MDKSGFYQKMQDAKAKKAKATKDKKLAEEFSPHSQPVPLDHSIETRIAIPTNPAERVEAREVVIKSQTPLERTIQTLREKAQGL